MAAPDSLASSIQAAILRAFPSTSPTTGLIWASAARTGLGRSAMASILAAERQIQVLLAASPVLVVPPLAEVVGEAVALHGALQEQAVAQRAALGVHRVGGRAEVVVAGAHRRLAAVPQPDQRQVDGAAQVVARAACDVRAHELRAP